MFATFPFPTPRAWVSLAVLLVAGGGAVAQGALPADPPLIASVPAGVALRIDPPRGGSLARLSDVSIDVAFGDVGVQAFEVDEHFPHALQVRFALAGERPASVRSLLLHYEDGGSLRLAIGDVEVVPPDGHGTQLLRSPATISASAGPLALLAVRFVNDTGEAVHLHGVSFGPPDRDGPVHVRIVAQPNDEPFEPWLDDVTAAWSADPLLVGDPDLVAFLSGVLVPGRFGLHPFAPGGAPVRLPAGAALDLLASPLSLARWSGRERFVLRPALLLTRKDGTVVRQRLQGAFIGDPMPWPTLSAPR